MNNHPLASLVPGLAVVTLFSLVAAILWVIGIPLAGTWSAMVALAVAAVLTLSMAYIFSHGPKAHH
jgi:urea transporter